MTDLRLRARNWYRPLSRVDEGKTTQTMSCCVYDACLMKSMGKHMQQK